MRAPRPQPWGLWLLLVLLPRTLRADGHRSLQYRLTAVSAPARGAPAFWATGWLGPQQYLRYSSLRGQAEPFGAWIWESQLPWYWEKETTDLRSKQALFLEALAVLTAQQKGSYVLQGLLGCELGPDNGTVAVASFALNGEEFMKFDVKAGAWDGDWPEAREIGERWRRREDAVWQERHFLMSSCPQRLRGHLRTGRGNLEWKEPPSMRLKARPAGPGLSLLTCSAFSFYPPELQLRFLRDALAAGAGAGDCGPNGDGSFHAWTALPVRSGDEHRYRCVAQHAGLAQPLAVGLDPPATSLVPVVGIVVGFLLLMAVAAGGAMLWWRMRKGLPAPWILLRGDDLGALLSTGPTKDADP